MAVLQHASSFPLQLGSSFHCPTTLPTSPSKDRNAGDRFIPSRTGNNWDVDYNVVVSEICRKMSLSGCDAVDIGGGVTRDRTPPPLKAAEIKPGGNLRGTACASIKRAASAMIPAQPVQRCFT